MNYTDYETQRRILIEYLHVMIARCDWHGVADVAMDLRELRLKTNDRNRTCLNHRCHHRRGDVSPFRYGFGTRSK